MAEMHDTKVLVADSRRLVRELLTNALARVPGIEAEAGSSDLGDVLAQASATRCDVILLGGGDYRRGLADAVVRTKAANPRSAVLVVVESKDDELLLEAVEAGAGGYITLRDSLGEAARKLKSACADETVLPPEVAARVFSRVQRRPAPVGRSNGDQRKLTSREREVLTLLTDGLGNAEIAGRTGVSTNTVKNHLYSIYRKLGVNSRAQAFAEAARLGLVRR